jgi:hypothetical protein
MANKVNNGGEYYRTNTYYEKEEIIFCATEYKSAEIRCTR